MIEQGDSVEKLHAEPSKALREQKKRFLIVIDDIDRLSPDEALLIFRLVKSVGRLPNVMYLLVYDRPLAEKIVSERYPSEGPHYLEKIVQAAFELPDPSAFDDLPYLLHRWADLVGSDSTIVRDWTSSVFATDAGVRQLAKAFTSYSWSQGMGLAGLGDVVAKRTTRVHPEGMASLLDIDAFRARVQALVSAGADPATQEFWEAWQKADRGEEP